MDETFKIQLDGLFSDNPSLVHTQPAKKFLGITFQQSCLKLLFGPIGFMLRGALHKYSNGLYTITLIQTSDKDIKRFYGIYTPKGKVSWWVYRYDTSGYMYQRNGQRKLNQEDAERIENEAKIYLQGGNAVGILPELPSSFQANIANMEM